MKIEVRLGLKDIPGMLVRALDPISGNGGNIVSIIHSRGAKNIVEVIVGFSVNDQSTLDTIIRSLKKTKTIIREIKVEGRRYYKKKSISILLIGHVIDTDIQDTIDRINSLGMVSNVDVRMPDPLDESSVLMNVDADEKKTESLISEVMAICRQKDLLMIREM